MRRHWLRLQFGCDEAWIFSADAAAISLVISTATVSVRRTMAFRLAVTSRATARNISPPIRAHTRATNAVRAWPDCDYRDHVSSPDIGGTNDNSDDEFIELFNASASAVPLFDPANPTNRWKLSAAVDLFSRRIKRWRLVNTRSCEFQSDQRDATRAFRPSTTSRRACRLRSYGGKLDTQREDVELKNPPSLIPGQVAYVLMDKVSYKDSAPWPGGADGIGLSFNAKMLQLSATIRQLARRAGQCWSADANWNVSVITTQPQSQRLVASGAGTFSVVADGARVILSWRFNGAPIVGATNSSFQIVIRAAEHLGNYDVVVFNNAGSATSSNATLTLAIGASIVAQPQSVQVRIRPILKPRPRRQRSFSVWLQHCAVELPMALQRRGHSRRDDFDAHGHQRSTRDGGDYTVAITDTTELS
jgi:hypothetical protein